MTTTVDMERRARFEAIWAQHSTKVRAYCIRRVASHDADDVCAEIFLVVWRRIDEIPPPPKTLLYIYGIGQGGLQSHPIVPSQITSRREVAQPGGRSSGRPSVPRRPELRRRRRRGRGSEPEPKEPGDRDALRLGGSAAQRHRRDHGYDQVRRRPENPPFLPETGSGSRAPNQTKPFPSDRRGRSDMTHEQIDRMVRKANPVRDPNCARDL